MKKQKLPIGIQTFSKIIDGDYLYIDKTPYIKKLEVLSEDFVIFLRRVELRF